MNATYYCHQRCFYVIRRLRVMFYGTWKLPECKIIRPNGVESLWMRRSNGAMQAALWPLCCASVQTWQVTRFKTDRPCVETLPSLFRQTWRILGVSHESYISVSHPDFFLSHDCPVQHRIQTHSINHTYPLRLLHFGQPHESAARHEIRNISI